MRNGVTPAKKKMERENGLITYQRQVHSTVLDSSIYKRIWSVFIHEETSSLAGVWSRLAPA